MKAVRGQGQEESWRGWVTVGEREDQEEGIKEKVVEGGEPEERFQLALALLESSPLALCSV